MSLFKPPAIDMETNYQIKVGVSSTEKLQNGEQTDVLCKWNSWERQKNVLAPKVWYESISLYLNEWIKISGSDYVDQKLINFRLLVWLHYIIICVITLYDGAEAVFE